MYDPIFYNLGFVIIGIAVVMLIAIIAVGIYWSGHDIKIPKISKSLRKAVNQRYIAPRIRRRKRII